jgi:hypothetical protein
MRTFRAFQRRAAARLIVSFAVSAAIAAGAYWAGPWLLLALLFVLLVVVSYAVLTIAPDAIARWRGHHWRWSWPMGHRDGPDDWLGTRVPRRPRPPRMPPRAAAAQPERLSPNS